jgi:hypothetical protein
MWSMFFLVDYVLMMDSDFVLIIWILLLFFYYGKLMFVDGGWILLGFFNWDVSGRGW